VALVIPLSQAMGQPVDDSSPEGGEGLPVAPLDNPWPKPVLRLVGPSPVEPARDEADEDAWQECEQAEELSKADEGPWQEAGRRSEVFPWAPWARRLGAMVLVGGLVAGLSLPLSALGGRPVSSGPPPLGASRPGHTVVYTVRPGDTLWSIASRMDPDGDPRPLVAELTEQLGATRVVPGERLVLP
jgi:hypothetical protein